MSRFWSSMTVSVLAIGSIYAALTNESSRLALLVVANVVITTGYYTLAGALTRFLARYVDPNWQTKYGMTGFFLLCAATHLHIAFDVAYHPAQTLASHFVSPIGLLIHVPQAFFVWLFVIGMTKALSEGKIPVAPNDD